MPHPHVESLFVPAVVGYTCCALLLGLYGLHRYVILLQWWWSRRQPPPAATLPRDWPHVTVQLPIFNERYVVERLIASICGLDYPRDRLEIQILDDSTDVTTALAASAVDRYRRAGFEIVHLRRARPEGYKAGALQAGLRMAKGELVAIFDADFLPPADWLRRTVPHFGDPAVGMVQTRWGHLNREYSLLTQVQGLLLDGHFLLEHAARYRTGRFFNFNGTAGIWRRTAIEASGGWQHDTLTEDLDLSYRAQLAGWRFVFLPDVVAPAELPADINGFKSQQHRWAKGSIQTARKLFHRIWAAPVPFGVKLEASVHLTSNLCYPLLIGLVVLAIPTIRIRHEYGWNAEWVWFDMGIVALAVASIGAFYTSAMAVAGIPKRASLFLIPLLMAVGIALAVNNSFAAVQAGVGGRYSPFRRTPKYGGRDRQHGSGDALYRAPLPRGTWIDALLAAYVGIGLLYVVREDLWESVPFLVLLFAGFSCGASLSVHQWLAQRTGPA